MHYELPHLSKHLIAIIPDTVEAQDPTIHFKELSQFVKVRRRLHGRLWFSVLSIDHVRIVWTVFHCVDLNALALQPVLR